MSAPGSTTGRTKTKNWIIAVIVAFLVGLLPMGFEAYRRGAEATRVQGALTVAGLKNQIAAASLFGKRGEYEKARQSASEFFAGLRARIDEPSLPQDERDQLTKLAEQRDQIITLLARSDPAGAERLFELQYLTMQTLP